MTVLIKVRTDYSVPKGHLLHVHVFVYKYSELVYALMWNIHKKRNTLFYPKPVVSKKSTDSVCRLVLTKLTDHVNTANKGHADLWINYLKY